MAYSFALYLYPACGSYHIVGHNWLTGSIRNGEGGAEDMSRAADARGVRFGTQSPVVGDPPWTIRLCSWAEIERQRTAHQIRARMW